MEQLKNRTHLFISPTRRKTWRRGEGSLIPVKVETPPVVEEEKPVVRKPRRSKRVAEELSKAENTPLEEPNENTDNNA